MNAANSYETALAFQGVAAETERLIDSTGTTNGPFRYGTCTVLSTEGQQVSVKSRDGSTLNWVRPKGIGGELRCYAFENDEGRKLIVVKELTNN